MKVLKVFVSFLVASFFNTILVAQAPTNDYLQQIGRPDFTITEPVEGGFLNVANGNLRLEIPITTVPERGGRAITVMLTYDSKLWTTGNNLHPNSWFPSGVHNSSIGGWAVVPSGALDIALSTCSGIDFSCGLADETVSKTDCQRDGPPQTQTSSLYSSSFVWHSADGSSHPFFLDTYSTLGGSAGTNCPVDLLSNSTWANDGSGFLIAVTNFNDFVVYDNLGNMVGGHQNGSLIGPKDANGNFVSYDANGNLIDQLGRTLVLTSVSGSQIYYDVLNSQGTRSRYTLTLATINVNTAFGISGISEYNGTITTVQSLTFPNGTSYSFGYDSGTAPGHYGLLNSMQLPAGGQVQFGYSNFVDALGHLDRWVTSRTSLGNQWSYVPVVTVPWPGTGVDSAEQQVTVNRPNGESRIYRFALDIYSGSWLTNAVYKDASGNTLKTELREYTPALGTLGLAIYNCDATNGCNGPVGFGSRLPARLTTSYTTTGGTLSKKTEYSYDSLQNGNVTEVRDWDFYTGPAPANPTRVIDVTYAPASGNNIIGKPASLTVKDGSGNPVFQETMEYDNYTNGLSPSGAVQHDSNFGTAYTTRGNLTALKQWRNTDGAWLTTRYQYDDAGNGLSETDPLLHTTTFDYTDSWASFPGASGGSVCAPSGGQGRAYVTRITDALGHATSKTYYSCTGLDGSTTDPNNQTTTLTYDDIGRPLTIDYPDGGHTGFNYHGDTLPLTATKTVVATPNPSVVTSTVQDGLGRLSEARIDSLTPAVLVDITYDAIGRKSTESNPHTSAVNPTDGITTFEYDALDRMVQVVPQDGTPLRPGTPVTQCQPGNTCTDYSNFPTVTTTDQAGKVRRTRTDALGRLVEVDEPPAAGVPVQNDYATLQTDGNFVLYTQSNTALWSTGTAGTGGGPLEVLENGNLVLYQFKWQAGTYRAWDGSRYADDSCRVSNSLVVGQVLNQNQCLENISNTTFALMSNGELQMYDRQLGQITWKSNTWGNPGAYLVMQSDGNLVIYSANGTPLWASGTYGSGANIATLEDDGRLILYSTIWSSGTSQGQVSGSMAHPSCDLGPSLGITGVMGTGQCFVSRNGRFELLLQADGDLVLYDRSVTPSYRLWHTGTAFSPVDPMIALRTLYFYDVLGNLLCVEQHGNVTGAGCSAPASSDATSPWRVRRFTYDSLSHLLSASNPESNSAIDQNGNPVRIPTRYSYDADGNLWQKTSPVPNLTGTAMQTISYCYEQLHRVTGKAYSAQTCQGTQLPAGTAAVTYTYDVGTNAIGYLTGVTDETGSASYSYYPLGRLSSETRVINGISNTASYEYNLDGSLKTLHYPSGRAVTYTADPAARPITAADSNGTNYVSSASYNPPGAVTGLVNGGAVTSSFFYNPRLQLCRISAWTSGSVPASCTDPAIHGNLMDRGYNFNFGSGNNGNVISITNYRDTSRSQSFTYDALNRISSGWSAANTGALSWGENYTLDAWGNLQMNPMPGKDHGGYFPNASDANNRPLGFGYDAAGNLTNYTAPGQYVYDPENRIQATAGMTYAYDADGNRVEKSGGGTGTLYWYGSPGIIAESDLTGTPKSEYVFFGGKRIARIDLPGNSVHYYLSDHLNSTSMVVSATGVPEEESDYSPFGTEYPVTGTGANHYKFTGKEWDSETLLDYFGARYYGSNMGRFSSPDPSGLLAQHPEDPQSWNLYVYARNNPLIYIDPNGLDCIYATDNGKGVESIDHNSSSGECGETGGTWLSGYVNEGWAHYNNRAGAFEAASKDGGQVNFAQFQAGALTNDSGNCLSGCDSYGFASADAGWLTRQFVGNSKPTDKSDPIDGLLTFMTKRDVAVRGFWKVVSGPLDPSKDNWAGPNGMGVPGGTGDWRAAVHDYNLSTNFITIGSYLNLHLSLATSRALIQSNNYLMRTSGFQGAKEKMVFGVINAFQWYANSWK